AGLLRLVAKNVQAISGMRRANRATALLLRELAAMVKPGITTGELDAHALAHRNPLGAKPVFLTEEGFPGCINTSVYAARVHDAPRDEELKQGDVLSIDAGMLLDGYCGDSTITVGVGDVGPARRRLIETTRQAMMVGVRAAVAGKRVGDIG